MSELAEAQEAIAQGHAEAAEGQHGVAAAVVQGVPDMEVEVMPDAVLAHEGEDYTGGQKVTLPGPTALAFIHTGHVKEAA